VLVCVGRFVRVWCVCLQSIEHSQAISGGQPAFVKRPSAQ